MKTDILSEKDVKLMVDTFYGKVNTNPQLSAVFNGFAKVNWDTHLPRMYSFWNKMLFGKGEFSGNPFEKHIPLPVKNEHFDTWISLFNETIDELFEGEMAENTKLRASSIAHVFSSKLSSINS